MSVYIYLFMSVFIALGFTLRCEGEEGENRPLV